MRVHNHRWHCTPTATTSSCARPSSQPSARRGIASLATTSISPPARTSSSSLWSPRGAPFSPSHMASTCRCALAWRPNPQVHSAACRAGPLSTPDLSPISAEPCPVLAETPSPTLLDRGRPQQHLVLTVRAARKVVARRPLVRERPGCLLRLAQLHIHPAGRASSRERTPLPRGQRLTAVPVARSRRRRCGLGLAAGRWRNTGQRRQRPHPRAHPRPLGRSLRQRRRTLSVRGSSPPRATASTPLDIPPPDLRLLACLASPRYAPFAIDALKINIGRYTAYTCSQSLGSPLLWTGAAALTNGAAGSSVLGRGESRDFLRALCDAQSNLPSGGGMEVVLPLVDVNTAVETLNTLLTNTENATYSSVNIVANMCAFLALADVPALSRAHLPARPLWSLLAFRRVRRTSIAPPSRLRSQASFAPPPQRPPLHKSVLTSPPAACHSQRERT